MKFVIWGAGDRGRRLYNQLTSEYVIAFIDKNLSKKVDDLPTISFDEYLSSWNEFPIIISFAEEDEAEKILRKKGIDLYFKLSDACGPYQEPYQRKYLYNYIFEYFEKDKKYLLIGNNLHLIMIAQWIQKKNIHIDIYKKQIRSKSLIQLMENEGFSFVDNIDNNYDEILYCDYFDGKTAFNSDFKIKPFFDLDKYISGYSNQDLKQFKGLHQGKLCFIVATGPSLRIDDLEVLKNRNIDTFSMNSIYKAYDKTKWRPTYFVAEDYIFLKSEFNKIDASKEKSVCFFLGDTDENLCLRQKNKNEYVYHVNYIRRDNDKTNFSDDMVLGTYAGGTVTYACLQWAIYLGYDKIYLLGVDFSYADDKTKNNYSHFYKEKKLTSKPATEWVLNSYKAAKAFADSHGIKIYNATRGGKLEVFPRVDFDTLF